MKIAIYTSINAAYLDKALVLASSVRRYAPQADFHVCYSEWKKSPGAAEAAAVCEARGIQMKFAEEIGLPNFRIFAFRRAVVEMCTAVKGRFMALLLEMGYDAVIYLDPDTVLFGPIDPILESLSKGSIMLTPHQNKAAHGAVAVGHERTAMQFGVFNLGFVAVNSSPEGKNFAQWWDLRLRDYCYDDRANGLFTDQKVCDLVPALFDGVVVDRSSGLNVATWNAHLRLLAFDGCSGRLTADGIPVTFYHFSSFDSGVGMQSAAALGDSGKIAVELFVWYKRQLANLAKDLPFPRNSWSMGYFVDGAPISKKARILARSEKFTENLVGDPYSMAARIFLSEIAERMERRQKARAAA